MASIVELNVNAVKWKILGTMDLDDSDAPWIEIMPEATVAQNGNDSFPTNAAEEVLSALPWDAVKIQVKASVANSQGKVDAFINAKRR